MPIGRFIEEVHFGSTPEESSRIWWDICWIWGPPEDHLETLLRTMGVDRFRLRHRSAAPDCRRRSVAKLDLLDLHDGAAGRHRERKLPRVS